jgi:hypothetical protein
MCNFIAENKNAGARLGPRQPAIDRQLSSIRYRQLSVLSMGDHSFFISQGRRVFQRPANANVRLHR